MRIALLLLGLAVSACNSCYQLPFSATDRAWLAAYPRVGQQLTFRSNQGRTVRYRVVERVDTYQNLDCNWFELGRGQPAHFHVTLRPTPQPDSGHHDLTLYVLKWSEQQPATLDFRMAGLEAYFHQQYPTHHFALQPRAYTLAGRTFPNAYYFEAGRNAVAYGAATWRSFYWNPQAGLLRYELRSGETFKLIDE